MIHAHLIVEHLHSDRYRRFDRLIKVVKQI